MTYKIGDRVVLLHRGYRTGDVGTVTDIETDENGITFLTVDVDSDSDGVISDEYSIVYDHEDCFVLDEDVA